MLPKLKVLFVCTRNSCRSQMAEGWARFLHPQRIDAYSAGISSGAVDPHAVAVMLEAGVDIASQRSKSIGTLSELGVDWVITVCDRANEACPTFPSGARRMHVAFDNPPELAAGSSGEEALAHYRRVRDEIRDFVRDLPARLEVGAPAKGFSRSQEAKS